MDKQKKTSEAVGATEAEYNDSTKIILHEIV